MAPVQIRAKAAKTLTIEKVSIHSIQPHPRNVRIHDENNLQAIMTSLKAYGQRSPLVIGRGGNILKGCGTFEACKRLGWTEVFITRALDLTDQQELGFALADNKTSDTSEFDFAGVAAIMRELKVGEFDLTQTAFAAFEIEPLLEADWTPPEAEMPTDGEDSVGNHSVKFTPEQWAAVEQAKAVASSRGLIFKTEADMLVSFAGCYHSEFEYPTKPIPKRIK